jgi:hypothetical protein
VSGQEFTEYGPQMPEHRDLHRAREQVLEIGQAGGTLGQVAQARADADRTEAAFIKADERHFERDAGYRAEVEASYDRDRFSEMEAGQ